MQLMKLFLAAALMAGAVGAVGSEAEPAEPCLMCHSKAEFENIDAATIADALGDAGIPAHGSFQDLTEEQLAAIVKALTGR
jgi:hypothetical protein